MYNQNQNCVTRASTVVPFKTHNLNAHGIKSRSQLNLSAHFYCWGQIIHFSCLVCLARYVTKACLHNTHKHAHTLAHIQFLLQSEVCHHTWLLDGWWFSLCQWWNMCCIMARRCNMPNGLREKKIWNYEWCNVLEKNYFWQWQNQQI